MDLEDVKTLVAPMGPFYRAEEYHQQCVATAMLLLLCHVMFMSPRPVVLLLQPPPSPLLPPQ